MKHIITNSASLICKVCSVVGIKDGYCCKFINSCLYTIMSPTEKSGILQRLDTGK